MVEPRDRDFACQTETYAEAGHYGATVVSPGFKSSYGTFTCKGIWNIYFL
jgi:hypothetical protein